MGPGVYYSLVPLLLLLTAALCLSQSWQINSCFIISLFEGRNIAKGKEGETERLVILLVKVWREMLLLSLSRASIYSENRFHVL